MVGILWPLDVIDSEDNISDGQQAITLFVFPLRKPIRK